MSESKQHTTLVDNMVNYVKNNFPSYQVIIDSQDYPGDSIPSLISGYRPDLYAVSIENEHYIIGEAKTSFDLNSKHSENQIMAFLNYLKTKPVSNFMLSVPYCSSDRAKVMLYFLSIQLNILKADIFVFDECDCWQFQNSSWHLI